MQRGHRQPENQRVRARLGKSRAGGTEAAATLSSGSGPAVRAGRGRAARGAEQQLLAPAARRCSGSGGRTTVCSGRVAACDLAAGRHTRQPARVAAAAGAGPEGGGHVSGGAQRFGSAFADTSDQPSCVAPMNAASSASASFLRSCSDAGLLGAAARCGAYVAAPQLGPTQRFRPRGGISCVPCIACYFDKQQIRAPLVSDNGWSGQSIAVRPFGCPPGITASQLSHPERQKSIGIPPAQPARPRRRRSPACRPLRRRPAAQLEPWPSCVMWATWAGCWWPWGHSAWHPSSACFPDGAR